MDIAFIKAIVELMKDSGLAEFEMEEQGVRLSIKRSTGGESQVTLTPLAAPVVTPIAPPQVAAPAPPPPPAPETTPESKWVAIKSPIVGTFYRASAPDAEPFVTVGQAVEPETVVCIIEAMKVMNEIKAEVRGIVRKILVDNGTAVQYGQELMLIEPT